MVDNDVSKIKYVVCEISKIGVKLFVLLLKFIIIIDNDLMEKFVLLFDFWECDICMV